MDGKMGNTAQGQGNFHLSITLGRLTFTFWQSGPGVRGLKGQRCRKKIFEMKSFFFTQKREKWGKQGCFLPIFVHPSWGPRFSKDGPDAGVSRQTGKMVRTEKTNPYNNLRRTISVWHCFYINLSFSI